MDDARAWAFNVLGTPLRTVRVRPVDRAGAASVVRRIHELTGGADGLPLRLWDQTTLGPADAPFRLVLTGPDAVRALLPPSDLRAGEAYVDGHIDIEGDAVAAMAAATALGESLGAAALARVVPEVLRLPAAGADAEGEERARLRGRPHSPARDRQAVQFHYDVGNDFFGLFLDEAMVYSCAYVLDADEDLETAQRRKLDVVCRKLRLQPGDRLLDVGCGWGSLVIHAAREYGVSAVGITLSGRQLELGRALVADAGLSDLVELRLQDYRDVTGRFDAIASIGMFEHVGPSNLSSYFTTLRALLADGGRILNHGITTGRRMSDTDYTAGPPSFVSTYVFPDGGLSPAWRAVQEVEAAGFEVRDVEQLRPAYAITLRAWLRRLEARWDEAVALVGERRARVWRIYLAGSAALFERGDLGVVQVLGTTGDAYGPLGRDWMLPGDVRPGDTAR
ncbi:class I SAM-dependent methyltransferase [Euzebya sp.]|uniref:class I SAM-dependent methyltransferase n=1 Tax=Euzebya sp. TaxID=1971409 RepID=UPI003516BAC2